MTKDEVADILIAAGLRGHPETHGELHGVHGDCALGVVHLALHNGRRDDCLRGGCLRGGGYAHTASEMNLDKYQCPLCKQPKFLLSLLIHLFEYHRLDFLTLGRKLESLQALSSPPRIG